MGSNWIENQKLMDSLYEKDFGSKEVVNTKEIKEDKEEGSIISGILLLPFLFLELLYRTFITEPKYNWSPKAHLFIGVTKFFTYGFVLYNISYIGDIVEKTLESDGLSVFVNGFIVIFSLIQGFYGILVAGGIASDAPVNVGVGAPRTVESYMASSAVISSRMSNNAGSFENNNEFDSTHRYMNAKMGGMSNRKKEEYLGKFYGGGK